MDTAPAGLNELEGKWSEIRLLHFSQLMGIYDMGFIGSLFQISRQPLPSTAFQVLAQQK